MKRHDQHVKEHCRLRARYAVTVAKALLKQGDRVRVKKCPGTRRWMTFDHWDGMWMVSKSGIDDYFAGAVDMVNDKSVDFYGGFDPLTIPTTPDHQRGAF